MTEPTVAGAPPRGDGDGAARLGQEEIGNRLLRALPPADFALIGPHLARVRYEVGDEIAEAGTPIGSVWFPEAGVAGILDRTDGDRRLAVGLVGREGMLGWPVLLGEERWPHDVAMRAETGTAIVISAAALIDATERSLTLARTLLQFAHVFGVQQAQSVCSALIHPVDRRMARWVLLYHDRVEGDEIALTHEEFRLMLGVRRSSITDALHRLESERAVRGLRGRVVVRDRERLLQLAGETYGKPEAAYRRLIEGEEGPGQLDGGGPIGRVFDAVIGAVSP